MTPKRLFVLLGTAAAAVGFFTAPSIVMVDAFAHPADCHAEQTCPADDGSYAWYDGNGQGWQCTLAGDAGVPPDATSIVYDGHTFACYAVSPPPVTTPAETTPTETTTTEPKPAPRPPPPAAPKPTRRTAPKQQSATPQASGRPSAPTTRVPPVRTFLGVLRPKLTAGGYVFPVYGPSSFTDTFGAARATTAWHHGIDIFAPLGAPILAVADGTVFSVGWNDIGGNRLWLRDAQGNQFYYAHLSAFSPLARNGARVQAGAVLGFMGNTGDAAGTPYHLHFEIHPVNLLHLGYDGVINPMSYLLAWQRLQDVRLSPTDKRFAAAAGWASPLGGDATAPRPGAVLLQLSDISTASGLERGSLARALATPVSMRRGAWPLDDGGASEPVEVGRDGEIRPTPASQELGSSPQAWAKDVLGFSGPLVWDLVAQCEAGGDWSANTGNGYFGGLQFLPGTWARYGGLPLASSADKATREEQITIAERVLASEGWGAWPACSAKLGLR